MRLPSSYSYRRHLTPNLRKHRTKCGRNSREKCTYCDKDFGEERSKRRHESGQHHVCHKCHAVPQSASTPELEGHAALRLRLPSAADLKTHDAIYHKVECRYCREHLANKRYLNIHHAVVHGKGTLCDLENCDAVLATPGDLERHYERDHKLKPRHRCQTCGAKRWTERKLGEHTCPGRSLQPSAVVYNPR